MNPELPHAPNPPFGALLYYHLSKQPAGEIKLQIFDAADKLVRTITSTLPPVYRAAAVSRLLADAAVRARALDERRHEPDQLGSALRRSAGLQSGHQQPDELVAGLGHAGAARAAGVAGHVHGQADRRRRRRTRRRSSCTTIRASARVAAVMAALRAQNKLAMAAVSGDEGQLRRQRAKWPRCAHSWPRSPRGSLPPDVAAAATALDAKLATFGGRSAADVAAVVVAVVAARPFERPAAY